ncbi:NUDIX hydrolase [Neisseria weaveri]|uniref:Putative NUDIX hydrolase n=1 Tax=Neisseria weaveri TaxID=28091 RepID=A0A3S5CAV8_9NEIS|nr:CoA pyrophosphatase [Neisseria weaveri]EGV35447.1 MutT/NUDIX family protein [Neisseria weaveri ATCC 51223]EGV37805.1 MutT/NUDIX family protein [Neisseria weaveri LMG 5135]VEJ51825.1 putative NUDIX hydrolase [Neisseria weaveri]
MTQEELTDFYRQAHRYPARGGLERNRLFASNTAVSAAVLLATVYKDGQWQILLTRRAETLRRHNGQIAFAGGRYDSTDTSLTHTALRETFEETGIAAHHWNTFSPFTPYYTPSGYSVLPVPALCAHNPETLINTDEVAEIFYLPLTFALQQQHYQTRAVKHGQTVLRLPALPYLDYDIWGLTAIILYDLAERYRLYTETSNPPIFSDGLNK